jgi:hypothetical protein
MSVWLALKLLLNGMVVNFNVFIDCSPFAEYDSRIMSLWSGILIYTVNTDKYEANGLRKKISVA